MHPVWVLYLARCSFWLTSTWGGGGAGGMGKVTEDDNGGRGVILGQILAEVICERPLRFIYYSSKHGRVTFLNLGNYL